MDLKVTLIYLIICIFSSNIDAKLSATSWESIEKWTDVCIKGSQANDVNSAIEVVNALGNAIPYAGPFSLVLSAILSNLAPNDMQQIKNKLNEMDKKLDDIDRHIGEVIMKIESVAIETQYKNQIKYLRDLKDEYKRFIGNPTNITRHDFHHKCGDLKAIEFIHYIDREMNNEDLLPLRKEMAESFDIAKVHAWSGRIATMLADATFLHFTCIGASGFSAETINKTLDGVNGDRAIVQGLLNKISSGIQRIKSHVEEKFFEHAKNEVYGYLSAYDDVSHDVFANRVYDRLTTKYPFRDWYVLAWKTNGESYHFMGYHSNVNSYYWHKVHNRCLIVAAAPPGRSERDFVAKRDRCLVNYRGSSSAKRIQQSLSSCLGPCELIAVVYKGGLTGAFRGTAVNYYTYKHINSYNYHITTIPQDNTAFYSEISNQTALVVVGEPDGDDFEESLEEFN